MIRKTLYSCFFAFLLFLHGLHSNGENPPNIIILLTDDQSYLTMGCYGNPDVQTPHLDRLASQGVVFDRAYDTTAICMASRAQIMTGMYEYKTGCNFSHGPLTRDKWELSYPVLLRDAGYYTGFIGKFGFSVKQDANASSSYHSNADLPMDSFDEWFGWPGQGKYKTAENEFVSEYAEEYPHVTRACGAVAKDFITRAKQQGKPFCLSVSFKASHGPMSPDPFFDHVYADKVWPQPPNFDEAGAAHIPIQAKSGRQYLHINDFEPDSYQKTMRKYNQLVYGIDYAVGMIRQELRRQGLAGNTVIIFLTDNGYSCGAHGMGGKVLPYEEPSRSPMIIFDPRHAESGKGNRINRITANIDIAPTVLDLAGLEIPRNMDGRSLLRMLDDPDHAIHEYLLLVNAWGNAPAQSLAVVTNEYKYINWPYAEGMEPAEELYNLVSDQYEMDNKISNPEYQSVLNGMQERYDAALEKWRRECVNEGNYRTYARIYDRNIPWEEKIRSMDSRLKRLFTDWRAADSKLTP